MHLVECLVYIGTLFSIISSISTTNDYSSEGSEQVANNLLELLPLEKLKCTAWEYFDFPAENGEFSDKAKE